MAERILIVDDDTDTLRLVGLMLQRQGYQTIAASNGMQGLGMALEERPDLILLDVMMPDMDGYEVTRRLRGNPATAEIPILMFTAKIQIDDKVMGFEVGADDYLTKPTHPTELQAHVKALLARTATKKDSGLLKRAPSGQQGYVIGVVSARGGLGVSTFASNLAAALLVRSQADVILAELTPGRGTLGMDLGIPRQKALTEMLAGRSGEVTREKALSSLVDHNSGLKLLPASELPSDAAQTSAVRNFETLATRLSSFARFLVLDLGAGLPTHVQKLLPMCSECMVVLEGMPNTIQHTRLLIQEIIGLGVGRAAVHAILNNRQRIEAQMPMAQAQEKLGHPIAAAIAPAPELFTQALRLQTPAVIAQPANTTSQQFLKLADMVIERQKAQ
ncbi:MAG TPA: response regulator [Anaerolineales bacterium]|nr:response regulator [Anaerolineales bacterium]